MIILKINIIGSCYNYIAKMLVNCNIDFNKLINYSFNFKKFSVFYDIDKKIKIIFYLDEDGRNSIESPASSSKLLFFMFLN